MVALVPGCAPAVAPTAEQEAAYAETPPSTGETVPSWLYTHCGVESARIGGRWWHAVQPLYGDEGRGSPPQGWGDPVQDGRLTVVSPESAIFQAVGTRVVFVPSVEDEPLRICG